MQTAQLRRWCSDTWRAPPQYDKFVLQSLSDWVWSVSKQEVISFTSVNHLVALNMQFNFAATVLTSHRLLQSNSLTWLHWNTWNPTHSCLQGLWEILLESNSQPWLSRSAFPQFIFISLRLKFIRQSGFRIRPHISVLLFWKNCRKNW